MSPLEIRQRNAIIWLCKRGYRLVIGGLRDLKNFELVNKASGETEYFDIDQVLADYDQDRKESAAERRRQRKADQNA